MSYTEMAKQNMENAAIADAARAASHQKQVADAQALGEQTGADTALNEIETLLAQLQGPAESYSYNPSQGLAGSLMDRTEAVNESNWVA